MSEERAGVDRDARAWRPRVHDLGTPDAHGERECAGQRFSQAEEVGNDPLVIAGEPTPGSAEPGEDFVEDQDQIAAIALLA